MKARLYPRLALAGIKRNRRLYLPYILTCIGMVTMFYIMASLCLCPLLHEMKGGFNMEFVLKLGRFVIAVFALIFLIYTNSFLIRRRNKEFGLYYVLGMDKGCIGRIIAWESLFVSAIGLLGGIAVGIALSKFAELGLCNILRLEADYRFTVAPEAVGLTVGIFAVIFLFLFLKSLWQVRSSKPLELMHSENLGEKPPKANWILAVLGFLLLSGAYVIAVTIKNPVQAFTLFFVAVIMVILGTYLLFTAGSVALCRILQKNPAYYYKKQHFISVSSMAFRMKRNGAGLASICVLSTIVLVMLSSPASLYFGAEDSLVAAYPRDSYISVMGNDLSDIQEEQISQLRSGYEQVFDDYGVAPENVTEYAYVTVDAQIQEGVLVPVEEDTVGFDSYDTLRELYFIGLADYNRLMGTDLALEPGQAMVGALQCSFTSPKLSLPGLELQVIGELDALPDFSDDTIGIIPSVMAVVPELETLRPLDGQALCRSRWYYGYDLDAGDAVMIEVLDSQKDSIGDSYLDDCNGYGYSSGCIAEARYYFYETCGGLFFLGILLSIVFLFATVLIIYYKQISEGYEDRARFEIMQKVGMTRRDIRKSIDSQILTVFFAPLVFAGLHLSFAFPMVWKLLQLLRLKNLTLVILVTVAGFLLFALFYAAVYKATAGAYYRIVSGKKKDPV